MALFVLLLVPFLLFWTAPSILEWQRAAPFWEPIFPTLGFLMRMGPAIWMIVFIIWLTGVQFYLLRRRNSKRKAEAEKRKASQTALTMGVDAKAAPVVESPATTAVQNVPEPPPSMDLEEQHLAPIEDASSIRVTHEAEASTAKAVVDEALKGLEYSKLEAKVVCNGLSHSHGVVRLASFKRKFYLLDHKGRRIIKMLGASSLDAAKTEMLG